MSFRRLERLCVCVFVSAVEGGLWTRWRPTRNPTFHDFLCSATLLTHWPVVVDVFGDVGGRVVGGEQELFCLPAHKDQSQVDLKTHTQQRG